MLVAAACFLAPLASSADEAWEARLASARESLVDLRSRAEAAERAEIAAYAAAARARATDRSALEGASQAIAAEVVRRASDEVDRAGARLVAELRRAQEGDDALLAIEGWPLAREAPPGEAPPAGSEPAEAPAPVAKKSARVAEDEDEDDAPRPAAPAYRPPLAFFVIASVLSLAADLGSKLWAEGALEQGDVVVIDGLMHFDLAHNPGGAFGLLGKMDLSMRRPLFVGISILAVVFIVSLFRRLEPRILKEA